MPIEFDSCINRVMVCSEEVLSGIKEENLLSAQLSNIYELATRLQQLNLSQKTLLDFYQLRGNLSQPISLLLYQTSKLSVEDVEGVTAKERINQIILLSQYAHWYVDVLKSIWVQFSRSAKSEPTGRLSLEAYLKWYTEHRILQKRFQHIMIHEGLPDIDGIDFQVQQLLKGIFSIALDLDPLAKLDLTAYQQGADIWVHLKIKGQGSSLSSLLRSNSGQDRYYQPADQNPDVTNATRPLIARKLQEVRLAELSLYSARKAVYSQHGQLIVEADKANLNLIFSLPVTHTTAMAS